MTCLQQSDVITNFQMRSGILLQCGKALEMCVGYNHADLNTTISPKSFTFTVNKSSVISLATRVRSLKGKTKVNWNIFNSTCWFYQLWQFFITQPLRHWMQDWKQCHYIQPKDISSALDPVKITFISSFDLISKKRSM